VDVDSLSDANGPGELCEYLYGDDFSNEEEAARLARLRAEEIACRKTRYYSEGAVCGFRTGYTFKLKQHPNALYNGKDYLLIEVSHEGTGLDSAADAANDKAQYSNAFVAIEVSTQFRPPLLTKKPRFYGTITAFVYAEAATGMAEVDAQGRYRVHLPFDRAEGGKESSDPNRKASCWVRMAQPFVGEDEGMYFPLKGGTEVLLTFINGDPDRPIISSALPNAATPSLLTDQTSTESIIKTGADNKIRMEDKKGSERIIMESPTANSWVRIGAPNDPADPYVVVEGKELSTYTDGDGSWQLIDASGNPITSKIAAIGDSAATYRLTKSLTVKRGSYFVTDTSPETALSGLPPSLNSSHRIDSRSYTLRDDLAATPISDGTTSATDFKDNLNRNYSFNVRNDSNKYQVDDDPLTGFSPSIGSSHTIFGTAWVLDEDMNTLNMNDGSSGLVRFYRDKSVALQVKTSGTDVDTGPGIRVRTGGNLWLEAKGQYGDYYVGKPSDAPSGVQSILDEIGGPSINPSGLKNHSSGVGEPLMNAIASAHVRVSDLDTFVLQKGYIYDFGPGANYNLVNGYIENHTNQSAALNQTAIRDRSQRPIGSDGKPIFGPLDGDLLNAGGPNWSSIIWPSYPGKLNSGQTRLDGNWSNANVWAEKKVGNAYDYMKGDSISVTKGDSLDVTYTGHRQVEVKLRDGKAPSYWKESEGGVTEEKKWNSDGDLLYRKTSTFATHTSSEWKYDINAPYGLFSYSTSAVSGAGVASFDFLFKASASALFNFGVSSSFTTSLAAKVDLELSAAANMKIGIGAGFDLKMYWNPAGELKLKNGEFEYHGIGSRLDKEAALKAKKQDLYLHYLTAHFSKRETELIATQVKVAAEKIGIKEGFSINL
ncbi:MAG: type VI secretion system Vgr family protein, partial [bacterium]